MLTWTPLCLLKLETDVLQTGEENQPMLYNLVDASEASGLLKLEVTWYNVECVESQTYLYHL